ncbi:hypothetical protein CDD83_6973 [Cordyceps sp. RAO-2017]|nr:hypothetical protein CDD83_6973 [Cordyceps sp. RAO-2017]
MPPPTKLGGTSARAGNGNILQFFRPVRPSQPQTPPPPPCRTPPLSSTPLSPPPPSSSPLGSASTPAKVVATEIAASDDDESDGGSSDASLEDLSVLLGRHKPVTTAPAQQQTPQRNPYATPRAKRTAVAFHSSPLTYLPKHKFDFKALAQDARLDDATVASSIRAKEAAAAATEWSADNAASDDAFIEIVKERGGQDAQKVLRAVQRSGPTQSQPRYCFFDPDYTTPPARPVPKVDKNGPWRLLTQGSLTVREQHLASGLPQTIVHKTKSLPDALLDWILDELSIQQSAIMRQEFCNIVADCPEQVERLVTPRRLQELFIRLGAHEHIGRQDAGPSVSNLAHEPYQDRDWSCLQSFLWLLGTISRHLSVPAAQYATQTLLWMSMDRLLICNPDILMEFERAIQCLVEAIPGPSWDSLCLDVSRSLSAGIKVQSIRANALLCLPLGSARTHDLRRRLAVVFLSGDAALARRNAADALAIQDLVQVLDGDDFAINPQTDFAELRSSILLLDMAVDDGFVAAFDDRREEDRFNEQVDRLALKLGDIWRKINDSGMKLARTEAKSVAEWVQQRLSHAVRTRKKAKKSVFDLSSQEEDPARLQQQQKYMSNFLRKQPTPAPTEGPGLGADSDETG